MVDSQVIKDDCAGSGECDRNHLRMQVTIQKHKLQSCVTCTAVHASSVSGLPVGSR